MEVLATEATPCRLQAQVVRVGGGLVVLVLRLIEAAVRIAGRRGYCSRQREVTMPAG
jgi:hypothetical protein